MRERSAFPGCEGRGYPSVRSFLLPPSFIGAASTRVKILGRQDFTPSLGVRHALTPQGDRAVLLDGGELRVHCTASAGTPVASICREHGCWLQARCCRSSTLFVQSSRQSARAAPQDDRSRNRDARRRVCDSGSQARDMLSATSAPCSTRYLAREAKLGHAVFGSARTISPLH